MRPATHITPRRRPPPMVEAPDMDTCQAPCEPPCVDAASYSVEVDGKKLKVCMGHYQKNRRGQPLDVPLRRVVVAKVPFSLALEATDREALQEEADERGIKVGELAREILAAHVAKRAKKGGK